MILRSHCPTHTSTQINYNESTANISTPSPPSHPPPSPTRSSPQQIVSYCLVLHTQNPRIKKEDFEPRVTRLTCKYKEDRTQQKSFIFQPGLTNKKIVHIWHIFFFWYPILGSKFLWSFFQTLSYWL